MSARAMAMAAVLITGVVAGIAVEARFGVWSQAAHRVEPWVERVDAWLLSAGWIGPSKQAAAATLSGRVVGVTDGDTLTLFVGRVHYRVRLAQIDTPEDRQAWGNRATLALAGKVYLRSVTVEVVDTDTYGRLVGTVWLGKRDINRELVREGEAWVYREFLRDRSLLEDETTARESRRGLWSLPNPVAPWDWRRATTGSSDAPDPTTAPSSA